VVHRLLGREPRNGGHDPEGVAGEEHDVLRVAGTSAGDDVGDAGEGVGSAGVL
jgi:hypothetical protein